MSCGGYQYNSDPCGQLPCGCCCPERGLTGPIGRTGPTGPNGLTGSTGQTGPDGSQFYVGNGPPLPGSYPEQSLYIDQTNGNSYIFTGGMWVFSMNITGPQGLTGHGSHAEPPVPLCGAEHESQCVWICKAA